jgi:choline dehydrogenase-like flavoprotein
MLLCASETSPGEARCTQVCVVGSGPSGLMLTRRLVEAGIDALVLEAGPLLRKGPTDQLPLPVEFAGQPKNLSPSVAQQVGGTSALWHGTIGPLDSVDFRRRAWIADSGWPITAAELAPFYRDAARQIGATHPDLFAVAALPAPIRARLDALPFDRSLLENKLFQQPWPPKRFVEDALGCLRHAVRAQLIYQARAVELLTADNGARITGVLYLAPDGSRRAVAADHVVLCGGAYQNPRLLLNSRARWRDGIGNQRGLVGRYLADHPMGSLFQVRVQRALRAHIYSDLRIRPGQLVRSALRLTEARQEAAQLPNHAFYLRPAFVEAIDDRKELLRQRLLAARGVLRPADLWYAASNAGVIAQILAYRLSLRRSWRLAHVVVIGEQIPNVDSRVMLSPHTGADGYPLARADWRLCERDFASIDALYDLLVGGGLDRQVFQAVQRRDDLCWRERLASAAHHLGTCRMADAPASGVVDRDLKVFGTDNLYVCDGSVFPTTGNANPTLTAAALALRLGSHLAQRLALPRSPPSLRVPAARTRKSA